MTLSENELTVLHILRSGPATGVYGLDIVEKTDRIDRGSAYVVLGALEKRGLVRERSPDMTSPLRSRPLYIPLRRTDFECWESGLSA